MDVNLTKQPGNHFYLVLSDNIYVSITWCSQVSSSLSCSKSHPEALIWPILQCMVDNMMIMQLYTSVVCKVHC